LRANRDVAQVWRDSRAVTCHFGREKWRRWVADRVTRFSLRLYNSALADAAKALFEVDRATGKWHAGLWETPVDCYAWLKDKPVPTRLHNEPQPTDNL